MGSQHLLISLIRHFWIANLAMSRSYIYTTFKCQFWLPIYSLGRKIVIICRSYLKSCSFNYLCAAMVVSDWNSCWMRLKQLNLLEVLCKIWGIYYLEMFQDSSSLCLVFGVSRYVKETSVSRRALITWIPTWFLQNVKTCLYHL